MAKAFVDTTVMTDVLLKTGEIRSRAKASLASFAVSELPVFAIKEFKAGPLKNYAWMHNKLVQAPTFSDAIAALQRMSRTPRRYTTSTALEAVVSTGTTIGQTRPASLMEKYGDAATLDSILRDEYRLALKRIIYQAWADRRTVTTDVVQPLSCYQEAPPYENRGLIELDPKQCLREPTCCLAGFLRSKPHDLQKMRQAIDEGGSDRREDKKRAKALRQVYRTKVDVTDEMCRDLGDAIFVALAPDDAVILTTNVRDHRLLATAVGKQVETP